MRRKRSVSGNTEVLMVLMLPVLIMILLLGVDMSHAYSVGVLQKQALDDSFEAVMVRQEEVKFAAQPDIAVRDLVCDALARDGYIGQAKITYYEEPKLRASNTAEDEERHIVVEVAAAREVGAAFGAGATWPVTASIVWTMKPYASYQVYSPYGSGSHAGNVYSHGSMYLVYFEKTASGRSVYTVQDTASCTYSQLSGAAKAAFNDIE